ncbi:MAG: hypothetical protein ABR77_01340 [Acidimicrobiia bacterium BACL6 MAG-120322-bin79]|jgi:hypothetical protein|nr:MAG: hypothetical protein ABR78_07610 [Acidimicrobiia bacterium BACL6 MAG-120910-bin40]KRO57112.1 MAG: hypothetical protein ABR77_01340 [Acidimicrobiia bacterium BACL6 MAG-120322-bin79]HAG67798.1 hypothetical protein [Acidimicrobium sp.]
MHPIEHLRYVARATGADPVSLVVETAQALRGLRSEPAGLVLAARRIVERHPTCAPLWWLCASVLAAADPFEKAQELSDRMDADETTNYLIDTLPADATVCMVGWSPTALEAIARRGDCRAIIVDSFGTGDAAVNALERLDIEVQGVTLEHAAIGVQMSDVVIIDALGCGGTEVLSVGGAHAVAALAYCNNLPAWTVTRLGTRLPIELWNAMKLANRDADAPWRSDVDVIPRQLLGRFIGPTGISNFDIDTGQNNAQKTVQNFVGECPASTEMLVRSAM